ncbi:photoreceptor cilium actin regulator [Denticeps clupeoides]|uniref:Photoreceptor cilium actin regulator n=1 Tax=Denticeps clupeoides TaxID=299321 RepID=A0AAY4AFH1_9TELE|nr:photoreceptor cilium actin regulator [Denticeps clupeoides]
MGCSPSKGNNFTTTQGTFKRGRTLLPGTQKNAGESESGDSVGPCNTGEMDRGTLVESIGERNSAEYQKHANLSVSGKKPSLTENKMRDNPSDKISTQEIAINMVSEPIETCGNKQESLEKLRTQKRQKKTGKGFKQGKKREKEHYDLPVEAKIDFPEPLVKAHQAAYAYLNPSMSKFEILLGLLDQAAQTQISLQPMVTFMLLRYEEINRGLAEIVNEGEKLLKESGEHLAWPCEMKNLCTSTPGKTRSQTQDKFSEPPPDLLQQLLQYTIQRMQMVGQSVSGIGDSALEEAVEYFSSVSGLLQKKLKVKRASEARLMQLLTRIEAASLRQPGPEDSALFSEDSGIGAESESLAGSDRHPNRRGSCESIITTRTTSSSPMGGNMTPIHKATCRSKYISRMSTSISLNSIDSICNVVKDQRESVSGSVSLDDPEGEEEDEEEGDNGKGHACDCNRRNKCNSSPVIHHQPRRLPPKRIENPQNVEMTLKMKEAISGRIQFRPSQKMILNKKQTNSPKINRRQWVEDEDNAPKRPQTPTQTPKRKTTVTKHRRSQSADSVRTKTEDPTLLELARTQRDLNQRLERMSKAEGNIRKITTKHGQGKAKQQASPSPGPVRSSPMKSNEKTNQGKSSTVEREVPKGNDGEEEKQDNSPTSSMLEHTGLNRGRNSVKRLIDTFSQGVEEMKHSPDSTKLLGPLKGVRKCGVPIFPGLGATATVLNVVNREMNSYTLDKSEDFDIDNLPPPPPEVLMDTSFESVQSTKIEDGGMTRGRSRLPMRPTVSQRLRASMQTVTVLPSRGNMRPHSLSMVSAQPMTEETTAPAQASHNDVKPEGDQDNDEVKIFYKQAQKAVHLQHGTETLTQKKGVQEAVTESRKKPQSTQELLGASQIDYNPPATVPSITTVSNKSIITPPVSRARMLPSTPTTPSSIQRRLPSPAARQTTPPSTASPPGFRKLPTPPAAGQRTLPSPHSSRQEATLISVTTFPFKTPSPPASPKVNRWSRENSGEDCSSSRVFSNARSVFCPVSPSLFEAQPLVPRPPQAWVSTSGSTTSNPFGDRGRLPISVHGPRPFVRRSHSDRRPSLSCPRAPIVSVAETCGSEPAISTKGLEDNPTRDDDCWGSQSELRGATRSSSHPDLCIVGQALQRE